MKNFGFDRLRGVAAAAGTIGLGLMGGGSARAVTVTTPFPVTVSATTLTAFWTEISNSAGSRVLHGHSVTTTGGFSFQANATSSAFCIGEGSISTTNDLFQDFYDCGMNLAVDGVLFVNPDTTVDLTDTTVTTDTVVDIVPGVDAQIQYYFANDRAVVRGLYSLTNTTNAGIDVKALVMGDYGSDADTTVQATSDGDTTAEDTDYWIVTNDDVRLGKEGNDATATIASHTAGAAVVPVMTMTPGTDTSPGNNPDKFGFRYDVTIPANGKVRIMLFSQMTANISGAITGAQDFESLAAAEAAGLLAGLDLQTQNEIVNYILDSDDDGLPDRVEDSNHNGIVDAGETNPLNPDSDGDGLCDGPVPVVGACEAGEDLNANGVVDGNETDPTLADTDGDGFSDAEEIAAGTDPLDPANYPETTIPGDVTSDGIVNIADALVCTRIMLGLEPALDGAPCDVAPLDAQGEPQGDSQLNAGDIGVLQQMVLGI